MIPKFKAYLKLDKKIVDVREINYKYKEIAWADGMYTEVDNFEDVELLQSTGLKDKNGVEIFEGDILHHNVQGTSVVYYPFRGNMDSFGTRNIKNGLGTTLRDTEKVGYEIIGNKFENRELLYCDSE